LSLGAQGPIARVRRFRRLSDLLGAGALTLAALLFFGPAAAALAADLVVGQHNLQFSQSKVSIHPGDTITFINQDDVTHNISVRSGAGDDTRDLGLQHAGVKVSYRFESPGVYSVVCSIHPRMRLSVDVH
jgi:cytochrome c peroxidase